MSLIEIPKYITSEADLDAYFKNQGTKVIRHDTGVKTAHKTEEQILKEDAEEQSSRAAAMAAAADAVDEEVFRSHLWGILQCCRCL